MVRHAPEDPAAARTPAVRKPNRFSSTSAVCSKTMTFMPSRTREMSGAARSSVRAPLPTMNMSYARRGPRSSGSPCRTRRPGFSRARTFRRSGSKTAMRLLGLDRLRRRQNIDGKRVFLRLAVAEAHRGVKRVLARRQARRQLEAERDALLLAGRQRDRLVAGQGVGQAERPLAVARDRRARVIDDDELLLRRSGRAGSCGPCW